MKYLTFLIPLFVIVGCKTTNFPNQSTTDCEAYCTRLSEELAFQKKWINKHFLCKTCIDDKNTFCTIGEIKWNNTCFRPIVRSIDFQDSLKISYHYIHADSINFYWSTFDYSIGAWVFVKNQEDE